MMKRFGILAAAIALASASLAAPAFAGTQSPTLTVNATVITNCTTMSSQTLNIGNYDPLASTDLNSAGDAAFTTKCSSGDTVSFSLDNGGNYGSAGGSYTSDRALKSGTNYLAYLLCTAACNGSNYWSGSYTKTGAGVTGTALEWDVYGQIPHGQDAPATGTGTLYTDTVTATLSY